MYMAVFLAILFIATASLRGHSLASTSSKWDLHVYKQSSSRPNNDTLNEERAKAVRDAFIFAYDGYWETCKGEDELLPTSGKCGNPR